MQRTRAHVLCSIFLSWSPIHLQFHPQTTWPHKCICICIYIYIYIYTYLRYFTVLWIWYFTELVHYSPWVIFLRVHMLWILADCLRAHWQFVSLSTVLSGGGSLEALAFSSTGTCTCCFNTLRKIRVDIVLPSQVHYVGPWPPPWGTQPCCS